MIKKTFTVWLFDKDSKQQVWQDLEAFKIIQQKAVKHFGGATIYKAFGIYTHNNGTIVEEPSIRVETFTDKNHQDFVNELKEAFNQESIMYNETQETINFL